jgi:hypothetical protein
MMRQPNPPVYPAAVGGIADNGSIQNEDAARNSGIP